MIFFFFFFSRPRGLRSPPLPIIMVMGVIPDGWSKLIVLIGLDEETYKYIVWNILFID